MSYEKMRLTGVHNHYGARDTGGTQGVNPEYPGFSINFDGDKLPFKFPVSKECATIVTGINKAALTGTVTTLTVGGVDIKGATAAAPVVLPKDSTGELVVAGPTAGTLIFEYHKFMG